MYPKNIAQYTPTASEQIVYYELKKQLPDSFEVFYSVSWTTMNNGKRERSEADFVIVSPDYGYLCIEVKGGNGIKVEDNKWILIDNVYGDRTLNRSPYEQAELSMEFFRKAYSNECNLSYPGIYGAGVIFPFYSIENAALLSNRDASCTIDSIGLNDLYNRIKQLFRYWGGSSYGFRLYAKNQHKSFVEIIKKRIAIDAAAGALVKYKERQLDVINRVQDGYIFFLSNIRQFYVRGGAGTGKTWIAMKMAEQEAKRENNKVLFLCFSPHLANMVRSFVSDKVSVMDIQQLINEISISPELFSAPTFKGVVDSIKPDAMKYNAVFIDEAQDFTEELAFVARSLLMDENNSRLGVFYDDVQKVRSESFGDAFMISTPPFLLRENIRNTSNIYSWAMSNTDLGTDVIVNPVEGPSPVSEKMHDWKHLTHRLESILKKIIQDEALPCSSLVILSDNPDQLLTRFDSELAKWRFVKDKATSPNEIKVSSVEDFKGLEADMIIFIHSPDTTDNINYIAYTRARYYLIELIVP